MIFQSVQACVCFLGFQNSMMCNSVRGASFPLSSNGDGVSYCAGPCMSPAITNTDDISKCTEACLSPGLSRDDDT